MKYEKILTTLALAGISTAGALTNPATTRTVIKLDGTQGFVTQQTIAGTTYSYMSGDHTFDGDKEYVLDNITFVENGVLTIEAGAIVRGEVKTGASVNDPGSLVITRTGRIDAQGTASDPIIFTTAALANGANPDVTTDITGDSASGYTVTRYGAQVANGAGNVSFHDADPIGSPLMPVVGDQATFAALAGTSPYLDGSPVTQVLVENRGLWGGIVILGNAPTSNGQITDLGSADYSAIGSADGDITGDFLDNYFEGFIEGMDIVDLGERGVYGGRDPNDNSGILTFVSIRHGGSEIGAANEINGLTMGGVGRGTLIENVEVYCNDDDGFEWFGGTVDGKNLISLFNNDDSFDIDEGYTGRLQFLFSLSLDDTVNSDHGGEHDGTDANHNSVGVDGGSSNNDDGIGLVPAFVTIYNATYIGGGTNGNNTTDSGANTGLRMRDSWGGSYSNSILSDFADFGMRIDSDNQARLNDGEVNFFNNIFYGNAAAFASAGAVNLDNASRPISNFTTEGNTFDVDAFAQRRAGLINPFGPDLDPKFDRRAGIDPRADSFDPAGTGLAAYPATFFTEVGYKGAFSPSASSTWADDWSVAGQAFIDLQ